MNTGTCPLCGGNVLIAGHMSGVTGDYVLASLCCGAPADLLLNWEDVIEPLPDVLREIAIQQARAEQQALELQELDLMRAEVALCAGYVSTLPAYLHKGANEQRASIDVAGLFAQKEISNAIERS